MVGEKNKTNQNWILCPIGQHSLAMIDIGYNISLCKGKRKYMDRFILHLIAYCDLKTGQDPPKFSGDRQPHDSQSGQRGRQVCGQVQEN